MKVRRHQLTLDDVDGWRFHAIITNIPGWLARAEAVEHHHRLGGGGPEEALRQLKGDFGLNHAPVRNSFGNWLWWHAAALAYNTARWVQVSGYSRIAHGQLNSGWSRGEIEAGYNCSSRAHRHRGQGSRMLDLKDLGAQGPTETFTVQKLPPHIRSPGVRVLALPESFRTCRRKRLRLSFFNVAAKVVRHGRRLLLRLPRAYPHALAFLAALQRLRLLPTFA